MTLPEPKLRIEFDEASHRYKLDGRAVPSVTQVMTDSNMYWNPWANDMHRARGTAVHAAVELEIKGQLDRDRTHPEIVGYVDSARQWIEANCFEPMFMEIVVGSRLLQCCGKFDLYGSVRAIRRRYLLVDWKSGQPGKAAIVQLAGYKQMLFETYGLQVDDLKVVRPRPGKRAITAKFEPEVERRAGKVFASLCELYHFRRLAKMPERLAPLEYKPNQEMEA